MRELTGIELGKESCINESGQVVFVLEFVDGSESIYVASIQPEILPGDVNRDGVVDLLDIAPFVESIANGHFDKAADLNMDGVADLLDVQPFVELLVP